ncbi:MAG: PAS domain S-box protein [Gemmatimonadota bacterium]
MPKESNDNVVGEDPSSSADPTLRARREAEERHARAARITVDGIWEWDIPAGRVHLSPKWRAMLGLEEHDPSDVRSSFFDRIHPADAPRVQAALEAHMTEGALYDIEFRLRDRFDTYRWFWARGEAERSDDGSPLRMVGGITEVTARKEAEEALQRADRILRLRSACNLALVLAPGEIELLQAVCDVAIREAGYVMAWVGYAENDDARAVRPVAISGAAQGYLERIQVSWNKDHPTGLGPTGRCIRSGLPQAAQNLRAEPGYEPWREAAKERGFESSCAIPLRVDGETIGALMLYSSEVDAFDAEEIALLSEVGTDVSFGIRAKRDAVSVAAQQAELSLFRQAIDSSRDAFFVADAETGLFVDFNEGALRQLGYTREELSRMGPRDIAPDLSTPEGWRAVKAGVASDEATVRKSIHRRKDGSEVPVEISFSTVQDRGRTLILAIARDVSERHAAEREREELRRQLEQSQKMESVGRLAGGVAHDFNNLLTVVNATADLALAEMTEDSPLRDDLDQIRQAGERAARLTRQLLAFSRRQVMHRRSVQLNDIISDFLEMIRRLIGDHIELDSTLAKDLPPIEADPSQLEQVLMNLCVNARDSMPGGGMLKISTRRVVLDADHAARHVAMKPGRYVLLSISDTGEGMDDATRARIFEPFFTTKSQGQGTGLGLSTVYGIVKQTGGSIWVYSEVGLGTTFKVYFPLADSGTATAPLSWSTTDRGGSEAILVVDDEEPIRKLVRRLLERAGYEVIEAATAREAIDVMDRSKGSIDLVLTDLVMPGMSGAELATVLADTHPHVKLLLTTGYSPAAVAPPLPPGRAWDVIEKPYAIEELLLQVRRTLDR